MTKLTTASFFFLAAGFLTSVSILSGFQILFAIPLIYYTYLAFKNKNLKLPKSAWWLLGFAAVAAISVIANYDIIPKPTKNFGRVKYFLFGAFGILVVREWLPNVTDKTKRFLVNTFLLSVCVAGSYCIYTYFFTDAKRADPLTETMRYGYGSGMILLTLLSGLLHREKTKNWLNLPFGILALILGFIGMYLTYTRGALFGFLCGIPFVLYFFKPKLGLSLGGIAALVVLALGLNYLFGSGKYESRFLVNKNNSSDIERRSQWKAAIIATQEKPVIGWGLSNFHTQLKRIKYQYDLDAKHYDDAHSHNIFLEVASGTGLIGLFFFLGWLINWAWDCFRMGGMTRAFVVPLGVAFVVSSQFEVTLNANISSMLFFVYALSYCIGKHGNVQQS